MYVIEFQWSKRAFEVKLKQLDLVSFLGCLNKIKIVFFIVKNTLKGILIITVLFIAFCNNVMSKVLHLNEVKLKQLKAKLKIEGGALFWSNQQLCVSWELGSSLMQPLDHLKPEVWYLPWHKVHFTYWTKTIYYNLNNSFFSNDSSSWHFCLDPSSGIAAGLQDSDTAHWKIPNPRRYFLIWKRLHLLLLYLLYLFTIVLIVQLMISGIESFASKLVKMQPEWAYKAYFLLNYLMQIWLDKLTPIRIETLDQSSLHRWFFLSFCLF